MLTEQLDKARRTYILDCIRGPFNNIVYTGLMTLSILMAIRYYSAPNWAKAIIQSGESIGRLVAPLALYLGARTHFKTAKLAAIIMLFTAVFLCVTAISQNYLTYLLSIVLVYILFSQPPQLMLQIYAKNYLSQDRGSRVSTMFTISLATGITFSYFLGKWLDYSIEHHRLQFTLIGGASVISALFMLKMPSEPLCKTASGNPWQNISLLWSDKLFGWMVISYMLLGIGNAMVIPMRIEYMANPIYKIDASNLNITLINVVLNGFSMLVSLKVWGYIFDKFHFITTRLLINLCFILSFLTFFISTSLSMMAISIVINGFAVGGGMIVWSLWVTKIAEEKKAPAYMSAHMCASGMKGLFAPSIGYVILSFTSPIVVGFLGAFLILIASIMFLTVRFHPRIK